MENETRRNMLETYAKALEGGLMPLDAAKVLADRMEADRAFRDAVLLMAGCGGDVDWAMRFIAAPLAFEGEVKAMLVKTFKTGIDTGHLRRADMALAMMAFAAPTASQPLAVSAYLHWTIGDERWARRMVDAAFNRNQTNSLAHLVDAALVRSAPMRRSWFSPDPMKVPKLRRAGRRRSGWRHGRPRRHRRARR